MPVFVGLFREQTYELLNHPVKESPPIIGTTN